LVNAPLMLFSRATNFQCLYVPSLCCRYTSARHLCIDQGLLVEVIKPRPLLHRPKSTPVPPTHILSIQLFTALQTGTRASPCHAYKIFVHIQTSNVKINSAIPVHQHQSKWRAMYHHQGAQVVHKASAIGRADRRLGEVPPPQRTRSRRRTLFLRLIQCIFRRKYGRRSPDSRRQSTYDPPCPSVCEERATIQHCGFFAPSRKLVR
jgi:hypothetical protein